MQMQLASTFRPFLRFGQDMDRFFGVARDGGSDVSPPGNDLGWLPAVDVTENEKEVVVRAEVPGVKPDDIDVTVTGRVLTISGEKQDTSEKEGDDTYHSERRFGSFRRAIRLSSSVDTESISAAHSHGVLEIRLDKKKTLLPKRIPIEVAKN